MADNADKINIEVNNLEVGQVNNNMGRDGVNETLFGLEEENMELKHQLHSTYQELSCVRSDLFQLDSKFQDAESERIRLVKRVTDLFSKLIFFVVSNSNKIGHSEVKNGTKISTA